jgi:predicted transcriptional regulator
LGTDIQAARQGLMKFIAKKGGSIPMRDLHAHSKVFYQAGHQAFSELMEGLDADEYVTFDDDARVFQLTDKGRAFLENQVS